MNYFTNINDTTKNVEDILTLIDASIQTYNQFDKKEVIAPKGYKKIATWSGIDYITNNSKNEEMFGIVFKSESKNKYIFAFRGTDSKSDWYEDAKFKQTDFTSFSNTTIPDGVKVELGFFETYSMSKDSIKSMQTQLFNLLDEYYQENSKDFELSITGHSLGSALCELFTIDVALSRPEIKNVSNINYACPRLGNEDFVKFYESQVAQKDTKTQTLRVQNTYDIVPCVPFKDTFGYHYQHISNAYLIAFYKKGRHFYNLPDVALRHSALNYQSVLECASKSPNGMCEQILDNLESIKPNTTTVCDFSHFE